MPKIEKTKGRINRKLLLIIAPVLLVIIALAVAAVIIPGRGGNGQLSPAGPASTSPTPASSDIPDTLTPTNSWMNFYGLECTLDGQPLPAGTVITVRDPEGVLCGEFPVTQAGRYGLMPVYGDELATEADEGAIPGDPLDFYINGIKATVTGLDEPVWTAMGDLKQVNLAASTTH